MVAGTDCRDGDLQYDEQETCQPDGYGESTCPLGLSVRGLPLKKEKTIVAREKHANIPCIITERKRILQPY